MTTPKKLDEVVDCLDRIENARSAWEREVRQAIADGTNGFYRLQVVIENGTVKQIVFEHNKTTRF